MTERERDMNRKLVERRIRSGRYEWRCRCGRWYAKLAQHIHRFHRSSCRCLAVCDAGIKAGRIKRA